MSKSEVLTNYGWQQRIRRLNLPPYLKDFLQALLDYKDGCPSNETLADHLGVSVRRIQYILGEARKRELVFVNIRPDRHGELRRHFDLNKKKVRRLYRYRVNRRQAKRQKDLQAGLNKHWKTPAKTQFVPALPSPRPVNKHVPGAGGELKSQIVPTSPSFQPMKSRAQTAEGTLKFTQVDIDNTLISIEDIQGTKQARKEVLTEPLACEKDIEEARLPDLKGTSPLASHAIGGDVRESISPPPKAPPAPAPAKITWSKDKDTGAYIPSLFPTCRVKVDKERHRYEVSWTDSGAVSSYHSRPAVEAFLREYYQIQASEARERANGGVK